MVPLEAEPTEGAAAAGQGTTPVEGAAAPISVLSRMALKDALLEIEVVARKTRDVSSAAALQAWQLAEKGLGLEVDIEDPALRGLFGLHVVAVEELCNRVRAQAETTLVAAEMMAYPQLGLTAAGMKLISDSEAGDGSARGQVVAADLADADASTARLRERLCSRIRSEVFEVLDERLQVHAEVREAVRDRQRWGNFGVAARRDVAWLRRESPGSSGLRALSLRNSGPLEEAEVRHREASAQIADIDGRLLTRLMELGEESVSAVRRPWAALVQIQAEFFMAQQATWAPLSDTFEEFAAST
mmetsp:Transcript_35605/g.111104  ORF Transcript_35605/g.111104 Transcript_35605/m.111104 type:complete len:301 (+) Transcript_35605:37-939(+)